MLHALPMPVLLFVTVYLVVTLTVTSMLYFLMYLGLGNSEAGLIISVAMSLARFQYGIRQSAEMEIQMTSVDRIIEYSKLPSEASLECCNIII